MKNHSINLSVTVADTFWKRFRGWVGREEIRHEEALLISGCRRVHTFFMRVPIDVVYLDDAAKVVAVIEALRPWRISPHIPGTRDCLELKAGRARQIGLTPGVRIRCEVAGDGAPLDKN